MVGAIRKRDILAHPIVTIHCFGWQVFFRTLIAGRRQTFLSLLADSKPLKTPRPFIDRCISLEFRAMCIYQALSQRFDDQPVRTFFENLAAQEQSHAELLKVCEVAADDGHWEEKQFDPWKDAVSHLEHQMRDTEASFDALNSVADALRIVIKIESSEVNHIFLGVVMAVDSTFVTKLNAFWDAGAEHIAYIREQIPILEPSLAEECQELKHQRLNVVPG